MTDVVEHPSAVGLAYRLAQLERDRIRLLCQLEREQLLPTTSAPAERRRG